MPSPDREWSARPAKVTADEAQALAGYRRAIRQHEAAKRALNADLAPARRDDATVRIDEAADAEANALCVLRATMTEDA